MTPEQIAELEKTATAADKAAVNAGGKDEALNKASADAEEAVTKAKAPSQENKRTEKERAEFSLKKNAERLKELGGDPESVLGVNKPTVKVDDSIPDDQPLTAGDLRKIQKQDARKTAEQMVEAITDTVERERVKAELAFIVPSGDPQADFRRAQAAANSERNAKIIEEANRRGKPRVTAAGGSQDANQIEDEFVPDANEARFMKPPYNMTKEKILAARKQAQDKAARSSVA